MACCFHCRSSTRIDQNDSPLQTNHPQQTNQFQTSKPLRTNNVSLLRLFVVVSNFFQKPWSNGPASSRRWAQVELAWTCVDLRWVAKRTASFLTRTCDSQKSHFKADISCTSLANNRLMDVTQLALTWVGWPNGEKLALTGVQIWSRLKWAQVIASRRKCAQTLAKRSRK